MQGCLRCLHFASFCWILYSTTYHDFDSDTQKPKVKNKKKAAIEAWCGSSHSGPPMDPQFWAFLVLENPFLQGPFAGQPVLFWLFWEIFAIMINGEDHCSTWREGWCGHFTYVYHLGKALNPMVHYHFPIFSHLKMPFSVGGLFLIFRTKNGRLASTS